MWIPARLKSPKCFYPSGQRRSAGIPVADVLHASLRINEAVRFPAAFGQYTEQPLFQQFLGYPGGKGTGRKGFSLQHPLDFSGYGSRQSSVFHVSVYFLRVNNGVGMALLVLAQQVAWHIRSVSKVMIRKRIIPVFFRRQKRCQPVRPVPGICGGWGRM